MAVFQYYKMKCACGTTSRVALARSVNIQRTPQLREQILRGELHAATCPDCSRRRTVERPFYYIDAERHCLFLVRARSQRHSSASVSRDLDRASTFVPPAMFHDEESQLRVIFGMDELREKLVAQDAGFDDRLVELFKVLLVYEHPVLTRQARLRLMLQSVSDEFLEFSARYEHGSRRFALSLPRSIADDLRSRTPELRDWIDKAHGTSSLFQSSNRWVNMWRWSPQPSALAQLQVQANIARSGGQLNTASQLFKLMLTGLPRGNHLPSWAKQDLRALSDYARQHSLKALEDMLFEIRFGFELEDDWANSDRPTAIATLWQLLEDLPDSNVEGNTKIHEILMDEGGGGSYDPTSHDIELGVQDLEDPHTFNNLVRHEVGHAVHEMLDTKIDNWLKSRFGWKTFDAEKDAGIDGWVDLMGGWGTLSKSQKAAVRGYLRQALGTKSDWAPAATPHPPAGDPWYQPDFGPRLAFEQTQEEWYVHFRGWHRFNGRAFYLNYWYKTLIAVDESTLELVSRMPDSYAAMSHFEFFAELYALYHAVELADARAEIPEDAIAWLDQNISAETIAPALMEFAPRNKATWETITRPLGPSR